MIWNVWHGKDALLGIVNERSRIEAEQAAKDTYGYDHTNRCVRKLSVRPSETCTRHLVWH